MKLKILLLIRFGQSYVCYDDLIPSGGKAYDPTGSGHFTFWVNLQ